MLAYLVWILTGGGKMRWDKKDIPHKGWTEIGMEDFGGRSRNFGEDIEYERCEMCGNGKNTICAYYDTSRIPRRIESRLYLCLPYDR